MTKSCTKPSASTASKKSSSSNTKSFTKKKFNELQRTMNTKNRDFVHIIFTSLNTAIVQIQNQAGGFVYIHPIVLAIDTHLHDIPRFIVGCYDIRSTNNTAVRVRPDSPYKHHQILLSFDDEDYNMDSINAWKDEFMAWIRSDAIVSSFEFPPTFIFGGYKNDIDEPHYLTQYMLDGDVQNFVRVLYDDTEMTELMRDDVVRIGCFGPNATYDEVASRIL